MSYKDKVIGDIGDSGPRYGSDWLHVMDAGDDRYQLEKGERITDDDCEQSRDRYEVRVVDVDRCTYVDGVLSDNRFHPAHAAWFEDSLARVADCVDYLCRDLDVHDGMTPEQALRSDLCSDDPMRRAEAYRAILDYHGWDNGDSYPATLTQREAIQRCSPRLEAGYAFRSSKRHPREPETVVVPDRVLACESWTNYARPSYVGTETIDGTKCNAWRFQGKDYGYRVTGRRVYYFQTAHD